MHGQTSPREEASSSTTDDLLKVTFLSIPTDQLPLSSMAVAQRFAWLIAAIAVCSQSIFASSLPSPSDFLVHSISVNHELGGALHGSSQLHLIEQPASAAVTKYFIGLSALEAASLSSNEVNLKFGPGMLPEQRSAAYLKSEGSIETTHGAGESDVTHLYSVEIPEGFFKRPENTNVVVPNITISVDMIFHRLSEPLPKTVAQRAGVSLVWEGDSVPRTPYGARRVRVKAKSVAVHDSKEAGRASADLTVLAILSERRLPRPIRTASSLPFPMTARS